MAYRHTLMVECTNTGNASGVCQHLKQTGKSDHYGLWHCHDSAPQMGPHFGSTEAQQKKVIDGQTGRCAWTTLCLRKGGTA